MTRPPLPSDGRSTSVAGGREAIPDHVTNASSSTPEASASTGGGASSSKASADDRISASGALFRLEALAREAPDLIGLRHLIVNETRKLTRSRQIFLMKIDRGAKSTVEAISSIAIVDTRSLLIESVSRLVNNVLQDSRASQPLEFALPAFAGGIDSLADGYPFRNMTWLPLRDRAGTTFGGMLLAREDPWTGDEIIVCRRLAATFAHAWLALAPPSRFAFILHRSAALKGLAAMAVAGCLAYPVPMTALAPVEIIARKPAVVAAPIDGVIEDVLVEPSARVKAGDVLLRFTDTNLRNRAQIVRQEMIVAEAKVKQTSLLAFTDQRGRHEIGLARAELDLKRAELAFALELLMKTVLAAPRDGIAMYTDRRTLVGKPVTTGERIVEIANADEVEARIDLAVPDAIALQPDSRVKIYLDVDPLHALDGRVIRSDYRARPSDADILVFRAYAQLTPTSASVPRLGLRGTAQVYGDPAPLALYLLRRPISSFRQWFGI